MEARNLATCSWKLVSRMVKVSRSSYFSVKSSSKNIFGCRELFYAIKFTRSNFYHEVIENENLMSDYLSIVVLVVLTKEAKAVRHFYLMSDYLL